jgi:hypothetical protein
MAVTIETEGKGALCINITGSTSETGGGIGAVANPEGVEVMILKSSLLVLTASTGAATYDIGVAADAATASHDIVDDFDVNGAAANTWYNGHARENTAKTAHTAPAAWTADKFVTITGTGSSAGFTGKLFLEYYRV